MMKNIFIINGIFFVFASFVFSGGSVFAAEGTKKGGGGSSGCNYNFSTCYGATWRWYEAESDEINIAGDKNTDYVKPGKVKGCLEAGGYFRYAMVAKTDGRLKSDGIHAGDQFGLIGISGNSSHTFDSEFFTFGSGRNKIRGGMNYIPHSKDSRNYDWADVKKIYKKLQTTDDSLKEGFDKNSNLAWFCSPDPSKKLTLTAYAVVDYDSSKGHKYLKNDGTVSGFSASPPSDAYKVSKQGDLGSSVSVTMANKKGEYGWSKWGSSCGDDKKSEKADNKNRKCSVKPLNRNKTVYAYYKETPTPPPTPTSNTEGVSLDISHKTEEDDDYDKEDLYVKPGTQIDLYGTFYRGYGGYGFSSERPDSITIRDHGYGAESGLGSGYADGGESSGYLNECPTWSLSAGSTALKSPAVGRTCKHYDTRDRHCKTWNYENNKKTTCKEYYPYHWHNESAYSETSDYETVTKNKFYSSVSDYASSKTDVGLLKNAFSISLNGNE